MSGKKISLRDRNRAAMENGHVRDLDVLAPTPAAPVPADTSAPRRKRTASTVRVTVYIPAREILDEARSAYVAQLDTPRGETSFARWLSALLDAHNARTPQERAAIAKQLEEADATTPHSGSRLTRAFDVYETTLDDTDEAIRTDRATRPAPNRSSYAVEALREGVRRVREANGGTLPPTPTRLPTIPLRG